MARFAFVGLLACFALLLVSTAHAGDADLFKSLYDNVEQIVVPSYDSVSGAPTQVILFEMPGLVINREEYDLSAWEANGFRNRMPDAIAAQFVDRLPYYTGATFVDSGSRISTLWGFFMYQYIIPIVDDPVAVQKVNEARSSLTNGTLQNNYDGASAGYEKAFNEYVSFRTNCLAAQPGAVCASQGVIYRERLKRKWFRLEVARRDISAAESKIIALQLQDLKNLFAEQLYTYASNERVDMGGAGFGQTYYQTFLTPSTFWRWWPTAGQYDFMTRDSTIIPVTVPAGATIVSNPLRGSLIAPASGSGNYTYRPNVGFTGSDAYTYQFNTTINGTTVTTTAIKSIQVVGPDVYNADTAFVKVSASSATTSKSDKKFSSQLSTSIEASGSAGLFSASGDLSTSNSKTRESTSASGATTTMTFEIARVAITRPWLDTAILSFFPVAIRNLGTNGWSDGTITPAPGPLAFKFKLLPVSFIVARNIFISRQTTSATTSLEAATTNVQGSAKVSYGPFFSGKASASYGSSNRDYAESSTSTDNTISIRGPQIIGWVCTPIPPFPTSDEAGVRKWEADQIARQDAAKSATAIAAATK